MSEYTGTTALMEALRDWRRNVSVLLFTVAVLAVTTLIGLPSSSCRTRRQEFDEALRTSKTGVSSVGFVVPISIGTSNSESST